ncbi:MAG TPA: isochorismatase family protein [Chloroflexota bacterium]|nr:isochorismatase family protein [Chloroflexota bacterium]
MAGSADLRLPDELRTALHEHLATLRQGYDRRGWGRPSGYGARPAVIVIDLAMGWTDARYSLGTDLDSVVESTARVLDAARAAGVPVFFTTMTTGGPDDPPTPAQSKHDASMIDTQPGSPAVELDPRLRRRPNEKLIVKKYASSFKGTDLMEMLATVGADTVIVTGCSTSHCVYATCRDACSGFHVVVPREAVGERCELLHEVALFDINLDIGDVVPTADVLAYLARSTGAATPAPAAAAPVGGR